MEISMAFCYNGGNRMFDEYRLFLILIISGLVVLAITQFVLLQKFFSINRRQFKELELLRITIKHLKGIK